MMKILFFTLLIFSQCNFIYADYIIQPFNAEYRLFLKSDPVGKAIRQLKYLEDGTAEYSYLTDAKWFIFSDRRKEISTVNIEKHCIIPVNYFFQRKGTGKDKKYQWAYDVTNNLATNLIENKTITRDFPDNIQDKLSYHLYLRLSLINNPEQKHFIFPVISTSGSINDYDYQYDGEEELALPYGSIKTIKLTRNVPDKKRVTHAWFAPELNYLLVKLTQTKKGKKQFDVQLSSLVQKGVQKGSESASEADSDPKQKPNEAISESLPNSNCKISPTNQEGNTTNGGDCADEL